MIWNYLKIIIRNILNQKLYSMIKIIGFGLGIAACFFITLWIADELGYDKNYPESDRIYRVVGVYKYDGNVAKGTSFPAPFAKALRDEFPEIEKAGRLNRTEFFGAGSNEIRCIDEAQNNHEDGFAFADQDLLDILQIPMVYGDPLHALDEPATIVISKRKAEKLFPGENPVGRILIINNDESKQYKIGSVMNDPSPNSHFKSDFLMTLHDGLYPGEQSNWRSSSYDIYIMVRAGTDIDHLASKLSLITTKYIIPSQLADGYVDAEKLSEYFSYELQPISDIHLRSAGIDDDLNHGDIRFVWLFGAIAIVILLIAGINFINLSTARFAGKAKTVGFLKTVGAQRKNLISQFLTESLFFSFLSFILGIIITVELLPWFNTLAGKSLTIPWSAWWWLVPLIVLASIITGVLTGLYPSLYISSFKPVNAIKGAFLPSGLGSGMRSTLIVFQFSVSVILITCTLTIYRQFGYTINKNVGFDKEQVLLLHGTNTLGNRITTFKNELTNLPGVKNVTVSDYLPVEGTKRDGNALWKEGMINSEQPVYGQFWRIDHDYVKTLGMNIVEGRDFSIDMATDSNAAIVNQRLVTEMGLTDPIGKRIANQWETFEIIGVLEDFNYESVRNDIGGVCLTLGNSTDMVSVKTGTGNMSGTIQSITDIWDKFSPNQSIRYSFLSENYKMMYDDIQKMGRVFSTFAFLAIIIACMGLFALSSYIIERRTKEIGIRKVHGAKILEAMLSLNIDFIKWVVVASVIAGPIAYFGMHKWLGNFVFKTTLRWWIFGLAGFLALCIALVTVSWQSWRAATRNPVEALRYE